MGIQAKSTYNRKEVKMQLLFGLGCLVTGVKIVYSATHDPILTDLGEKATDRSYATLVGTLMAGFGLVLLLSL